VFYVKFPVDPDVIVPVYLSPEYAGRARITVISGTDAWPICWYFKRVHHVSKLTELGECTPLGHIPISLKQTLSLCFW
jgi:hypothetical protein